jgi:hypothetical protein
MIGMDDILRTESLDRQNARAREEYYDKQDAKTLMMSSDKISRYDYEANKKGCVIIDYDKFRKGQNEEAMLIVGIIGLYMLIGIVFGVVMVLS